MFLKTPLNIGRNTIILCMKILFQQKTQKELVVHCLHPGTSAPLPSSIVSTLEPLPL